MKFVCMNCETYMSFEKVEKPAEGSLGVFFACPSCEAKVSMVTNPGETQMVSSLGVQLGGRTAVSYTHLQPTRSMQVTVRLPRARGRQKKVKAGAPSLRWLRRWD